MIKISTKDVELILTYATDKTIVLPDYIKNLLSEVTNKVNESKFDYPVNFGNEPNDGCMSDYYCDVRANWYYDVFSDAIAEVMPDDINTVSELFDDYFTENDFNVDAYDYHYNLFCRLIDIINGNDGLCDCDEMICDICSELLDESDDAYWSYWSEEE